MINRLIPPTRGQILIDGKNIEEIDKVRLRRNIGYVIQQDGLFPHMTIRQNIEPVSYTHLDVYKRQEKYPRVTFDIFTATADLVKEQMDKGLLDIGLLLEPIDMEKYDFIRLNIKEKWVVLMLSLIHI